MKQVFLSALIPSKSGYVQKLLLEPQKRVRLHELGMLPGNIIECACIAPGGSPMAFWVKDALIALRTDECSKIVVAIDE